MRYLCIWLHFDRPLVSRKYFTEPSGNRWDQLSSASRHSTRKKVERIARSAKWVQCKPKGDDSPSHYQSLEVVEIIIYELRQLNLSPEKLCSCTPSFPYDPLYWGLLHQDTGKDFENRFIAVRKWAQLWNHRRIIIAVFPRGWWINLSVAPWKWSRAWTRQTLKTRTQPWPVQVPHLENPAKAISMTLGFSLTK